MLNDTLDFILSIPIGWQIILTILGFIIIGRTTYLVGIVEQKGRIELEDFKKDPMLKYMLFLAVITIPCCFFNMFVLGVICFFFLLIVHIVQIIGYWHVGSSKEFNLQNKQQLTNINSKTSQNSDNNLQIEKVVNDILKGKVSIGEAVDIVEKNMNFREELEKSTFNEIMKDAKKLAEILKNI